MRSFSRLDTRTKTRLLNHINNNHVSNTGGGGQAKGEELSYVQVTGEACT